MLAEPGPGVHEAVAHAGRQLVQPVDRLGDGRRLDLAASRRGREQGDQRTRQDDSRHARSVDDDRLDPQIGGQVVRDELTS